MWVVSSAASVHLHECMNIRMGGQMVLCIPDTKETATPGVPASEEGVGAGVLGLAAPGGSEAEGEAPPLQSSSTPRERTADLGPI